MTQLTTPHFGAHSWLWDKSPLEGCQTAPPPTPLKDTKEEATAAAGGTSLFQSGIVLWEKLYLKQSVDVEYCWYLYLCADLFLELVCVR